MTDLEKPADFPDRGLFGASRLEVAQTSRRNCPGASRRTWSGRKKLLFSDFSRFAPAAFTTFAGAPDKLTSDPKGWGARRQHQATMFQRRGDLHG
jgi:hypothetical protein